LTCEGERYTEEPHNLYTSPNLIWVIKSRMRCSIDGEPDTTLTSFLPVFHSSVGAAIPHHIANAVHIFIIASL